MQGIIKRVFIGFEKTVVRLNGWEHIPDSPKKFMYAVPQVYKGKEVQLTDGTIIEKGDMVCELHIDNLKMEAVSKDIKTVFKYLEEELNALAIASFMDDRFKPVKAFYARTVLYPIVRRKGFTIRKINKGVGSLFIKIWENILKIVFGKGNKRRAFKDPKECWISKEHLILRCSDKKGGYDEKASH